MAILELKNINKIFDKHSHVIKDLNLTMQDGEFTVFVGPSGCGKSTILRMIAGLEEITSGTLSINGKVVNTREPQQRGIAMVFQSYALYPHLTVYQNISFPLEIAKVDKDTIKKKVDYAAHMLNLHELLDRKPRQLSGGQRQRVALGRAMVREPAVFLLDEPLSNLDAKLRTEMRIGIAELHDKLQTNFIYVTHDQVEAMTLGEKICVLKDGIVQQYAAPAELYEAPKNMFVAGFIGSPGMNFFDVTLATEQHDFFFKSDNFSLKVPGKCLPALKQYSKKKLVLGIRPVDIYLENTGLVSLKKEENMIKGTFVLHEMLGDENIYYITSDSLIVEGEEHEKKSMIIKSTSRIESKRHSAFTCYADPDKFHLFDYDTQETLL
jgi:multiple sugar transport system ATP-binding protein